MKQFLARLTPWFLARPSVRAHCEARWRLFVAGALFLLAGLLLVSVVQTYVAVRLWTLYDQGRGLAAEAVARAVELTASAAEAHRATTNAVLAGSEEDFAYWWGRRAEALTAYERLLAGEGAGAAAGEHGKLLRLMAVYREESERAAPEIRGAAAEEREALRLKTLRPLYDEWMGATLAHARTAGREASAELGGSDDPMQGLKTVLLVLLVTPAAGVGLLGAGWFALRLLRGRAGEAGGADRWSRG